MGEEGAYDPIMEKFMQSLLTTKNIAVHLMEDVKLNLNGKHIFKVLQKTKTHIFVRKLALQMVMVQTAYFPLKDQAEIAKKNIFDNFETKAIEHFCSQMLMAMTKEMFNIVRNIDPKIIESDEEMEKATKLIDDQLIDKFHISHDGMRLVEDPTNDLVSAVRDILESLGGRWPNHLDNINKMRRFLRKEFLQEAFIDKALIQLSNMLAFLISKPELIFYYAPHLALNERLCVHLAENFEINRLNTKVI